MQPLTTLALFFVSLVGAENTPPCPTITHTTSVCSTCVRPMCMAIKTVTPGCGCPRDVAAAYTGWSCDQGCPGGCAGTEYVTATNTRCEPTGGCAGN
ncbi:hypothetical protein N3K66_006401 [Trichothecium roseum]|uniref:Uncharacterized protein n=1 Tax=Trichothecium roseum TaxID=47278 RepID=A0ACC0UVA1_9HYPO|nr:hypothetical protein N3K66_006401 [Trichothecium roseum]